jgi:hypothetical protein
MPAALPNPIRRLARKGPLGAPLDDVIVRIGPMTMAHVNIWHTFIQPLIDANYSHWVEGVDARSVRADVGWDWSMIYGLALAHNSARFIPGNQSGSALALVIALLTELDEEVPIGMVTVVPKFHCTAKGEQRDRTFVWFLADAPAEFYDAIGSGMVAAVAKALLDTAIQSGLGSGQDGTMLLHADPGGGPKLEGFYVDKCKMERLIADAPAISLLRRSHTDQYYHFDAGTAAAFSRQFDSFR